jgi:hypothetical protein
MSTRRHMPSFAHLDGGNEHALGALSMVGVGNSVKGQKRWHSCFRWADEVTIIVFFFEAG